MKEKFFRELGEEMGYLDDKYARQYYFALVRYVARELKKTEFIELPDFMKLEVKEIKGAGKKWKAGDRWIERGKKANKRLSIVADYKLRKYVKENIL